MMIYSLSERCFDLVYVLIIITIDGNFIIRHCQIFINFITSREYPIVSEARVHFEVVAIIQSLQM